MTLSHMVMHSAFDQNQSMNYADPGLVTRPGPRCRSGRTLHLAVETFPLSTAPAPSPPPRQPAALLMAPPAIVLQLMQATSELKLHQPKQAQPTRLGSNPAQRIMHTDTWRTLQRRAWLPWTWGLMHPARFLHQTQNCSAAGFPACRSAALHSRNQGAFVTHSPVLRQLAQPAIHGTTCPVLVD